MVGNRLGLIGRSQWVRGFELRLLAGLIGRVRLFSVCLRLGH